ncbi:MAG: FAD-dependent oxidoreductase [Flavobacteriaceae bacterium]|nr:FAD-dependent oxidoreductase [Flavobacteriaceae bacterium]
MTQKKVVVVGGGVVGLCTAYYLSQEGHEVTVIDKGNLSSGASHVNAGYLTPSHIIPMAAPGMVSKGFRWMFKASSPFYIKPRLDKDLIQWGLKFMKSCTPEHVQRSMKAILDINLFSKQLYLEMQKSSHFDFHLETKGLLMAYKTSHAEKEEAEVVVQAKDLGLKIEQLSPEEVLKKQPGTSMDIAGAFWYESDAHSTPELFMQNLITLLTESGVNFVLEQEVTNFKLKNSKIQSVVTTRQDLKADEVVVASGAWSELLLKQLEIQLSVQAGKGYRLNLNKSTGISLPAILLEAKVAVTPMQGFTRFGGTMELSGINHKINSKRVTAIAKAAKDYYPQVLIPQEELANVKCGLRPLSPDGLPFIGRHSKCNNLVLATGHSMMGWSLGPATGKLVTELISNQNTTISIDRFTPERTY